MTFLSENLPCALAVGVLALLIFHRAAGRMLRLAARSLAGLGFLALWAESGLAAGLAPGVNLFNALVLGALGVPGLGLLLVLPWAGT